MYQHEILQVNIVSLFSVLAGTPHLKSHSIKSKPRALHHSLSSGNTFE
jgi:hypothetical protein